METVKQYFGGFVVPGGPPALLVPLPPARPALLPPARRCRVLRYDEKARRFTVQFLPQGRVKDVKRLNVLFDRENKADWERRRAFAYAHRCGGGRVLYVMCPVEKKGLHPCYIWRTLPFLSENQVSG